MINRPPQTARLLAPMRGLRRPLLYALLGGLVTSTLPVRLRIRIGVERAGGSTAAAPRRPAAVPPSQPSMLDTPDSVAALIVRLEEHPAIRDATPPGFTKGRLAKAAGITDYHARRIMLWLDRANVLELLRPDKSRLMQPGQAQRLRAPRMLDRIYHGDMKGLTSMLQCASVPTTDELRAAFTTEEG